MGILYVLVPIALLMGLGFTLAFVWSVRAGQLEDLETPRHRVLLPEEVVTSQRAKISDSGLK